MRSLIIALSVFTRIPMPNVEWKKENMRYIFCWFPIIGAILGLSEFLWHWAASSLDLGCFIYGAVATVIPIVITGGIHIDGFMDTCDALSSHGDSEKMISILKDPHTGAFAIIYTLVYFILYFGAFTQLYGNTGGVICLCAAYVLVRAMTVILITSTDISNSSGLLHSLAEYNSTVVTSIITVVWIMGSLAAMEMASVLPALISIIALVLFNILFRRMALKKFGGMSGDLAGFFISVSELMCILITVIGGALV